MQPNAKYEHCLLDLPNEVLRQIVRAALLPQRPRHDFEPYALDPSVVGVCLSLDAVVRDILGLFRWVQFTNRNLRRRSGLYYGERTPFEGLFYQSTRFDDFLPDPVISMKVTKDSSKLDPTVSEGSDTIRRVSQGRTPAMIPIDEWEYTDIVPYDEASFATLIRSIQCSHGGWGTMSISTTDYAEVSDIMTKIVGGLSGFAAITLHGIPLSQRQQFGQALSRSVTRDPRPYLEDIEYRWDMFQSLLQRGFKWEACLAACTTGDVPMTHLGYLRSGPRLWRLCARKALNLVIAQLELFTDILDTFGAFDGSNRHGVVFSSITHLFLDCKHFPHVAKELSAIQDQYRLARAGAEFCRAVIRRVEMPMNVSWLLAKFLLYETNAANALVDQRFLELELYDDHSAWVSRLEDEANRFFSSCPRPGAVKSDMKLESLFDFSDDRLWNRLWDNPPRDELSV